MGRFTDAVVLTMLAGFGLAVAAATEGHLTIRVVAGLAICCAVVWEWAHVWRQARTGRTN